RDTSKTCQTKTVSFRYFGVAPSAGLRLGWQRWERVALNAAVRASYAWTFHSSRIAPAVDDSRYWIEYTGGLVVTSGDRFRLGRAVGSYQPRHLVFGGAEVCPMATLSVAFEL